MVSKNKCCSPHPSGSLSQRGVDVPDPVIAQGQGVVRDCVPVPGGQALTGTARPVLPVDCEAPLRRRKLAAFHCGRGTVTNAEFARFIAATGHITDAERLGWSFVFINLLPAAQPPTRSVAGLPWWRHVEGACWHRPAGPLGEAALGDHPVVQVSWNDARAYAAWAGGRLPTEAEWEHAARGGLGDVPFPWGEAAPDDTGFTPCNIWQGRFPQDNTGLDGYIGTAPAISFAPNGYGLYNMVGNVWEWSHDAFRLRSLTQAAKRRNAEQGHFKLLKGGSFLCHSSYCFRYRIAARIGNPPDTTTSHIGFRIIHDDPPA